MGSLRRSAACWTPLVSARIQHAPSETNSGFGPARARLACGAQTRPSRRTRAASKLEGALGSVLSAAPMPQVHPRVYSRALTCTYTHLGYPHGRAGSRRRAARGPTDPGTREPARAGRCRADTAALRAGQSVSPPYRHADSLRAIGSHADQDGDSRHLG
jgi:hypothetical protein